MDHPLRQSRSSSVDVSQLDKINAIPNKITDNVLMDSLCPEDQLYLNALMDMDSSNSDEDEYGPSSQGSTWSPMLQNPVIMNKRLKKLRPSYAVTLSLEDISYIRPSWGISKGVRTIELNKKKKYSTKGSDTSNELGEKNKKEKVIEKKTSSKSNISSNEAALHYLLLLLAFVILILIVPPYLMKKKSEQDKIVNNRLFLDGTKKYLQVYKPKRSDELEPILKVLFNQGLSSNIKAEECDCDLFSQELRSFLQKNNLSTDGDSLNSLHEKHYCYACLEWATRNNLRVLVEKMEKSQIASVGYSDTDEDIYCYHIKWQSYDDLRTPLVDCLITGGEQWLGLGDIKTPSWPLNSNQFDWTPLSSNLSVELSNQSHYEISEKSLEKNSTGHLQFGTFANLSLFSTNGIVIGKLRSDFKVSVQLTKEGGESNQVKLCLSASCGSECRQNWLRANHLNEFRIVNNILEYSICSANSLKELISKQMRETTNSLIDNIRQTSKPSNITLLQDGKKSAKLVEQESVSFTDGVNSLLNESGNEPLVVVESSSSVENSSTLNNINTMNDLPEGIGLIDRTIFATSLHSLPILDGQTLRLYVDNIVKLGLKTSSILLIDSRWETYVGSLKLNIALFPKSKLLFEILHNKGFKIVLTIKPYIDSAIGISKIYSLFDSGRIYPIDYKKSNHLEFYERDEESNKQTTQTTNTTTTLKEKYNIVTRTSLFTFFNRTIDINSNESKKSPYMFKCKESQEGYCALLDLTRANNRMWFINNIKKSNTLTVESNGILIGGVHPISFLWDNHFRSSVGELVKNLFYREKIFTLSQWSGDLGYIQLAPRPFTWTGLKSVLNSILNLGTMGFSLIHPGSVWGDLKTETNSSQSDSGQKSVSRLGSIYRDIHQSDASENLELLTRWLQVAVFLPILQFNDIAPIDKYGLQEQVQNLVKIRKMHIVPELKKNLPFTPTIDQFTKNAQQLDVNALAQQPLIRPVWYVHENKESMVPEQFTIGPDILVAPILSKGMKQRDIYLPSGFWHDELRLINLRGGKWLKNYPVEVNEIAWFTRAKR